MTTRNLTSAMAAAVQRAVVYPAVFFEGEFYSAGSPSAQYLRLWTGQGDLSWNGYTWTGAGSLLSISPLEESTRIESLGFSATLSGMPSDKISLALQSIRQGKPGKLWMGCLTPSAYLALPGQSGNYASTPDSAALDITGDIDLRVDAALDDWTPATENALVSKFNVGGSNLSYVLRVFTSGLLRLVWSIDGSAGALRVADSTVATGFSDGSRHWVRATLQVNYGSPTDYLVRFYTSSDGIDWTQLGAAVSGSGGTSIFSGAGELRVGMDQGGADNSAAGKIYRAQVYNGIGGTLVADFDPLKFTAGALTATASTGETWTLNQSVVGSPTYLPARIVPQPDELIGDPYLVQQGRFDIVVIEDNGQTCTLKAQYESRLVDLFKPRTRRYTKEDQALDYPGDTGFDKVAALQDMQLIWGGPGAATAPLAQPSDNSAFAYTVKNAEGRSIEWSYGD